jgi:hypothetical protein
MKSHRVFPKAVLRVRGLAGDDDAGWRVASTPPWVGRGGAAVVEGSR